MNNNLKKIVMQVIKFGIVGVIAFIIDMGLYYILFNVYGMNYILASIIGFSVSLIVNYILSMKYVFRSRENLSKRQEEVYFIIISVIGLVLNSIILYMCVDIMYVHWDWLQRAISLDIFKIISKIIATIIVMIYNFIAKKICLE